MDKYEASEGFTVQEKDDAVTMRGPGGTLWIGDRELGRGLKEYVNQVRANALAERDEQLGRWRWPENPDYVVYRWVADPPRRNVRGVTVLSEAIPRGYTVWEDNVDVIYGTSVNEEARKAARDAARAYFDAHPEPKPIPNEPRSAWVDKYGTDVWVVGGDGVLRCVSSPSSDPAKYAPFTRLVPEVSQ